LPEKNRESLNVIGLFAEPWLTRLGALASSIPPPYARAMESQDCIPRGLKLHDLGGIEVVAGRYRDHVLPRHFHNGLMLSLLSDGMQAQHYRGVTRAAGAGMILAVPPNEVHSAEPGVKDGWAVSEFLCAGRFQSRPRLGK
jgi:hypothetical protein